MRLPSLRTQPPGLSSRPRSEPLRVTVLTVLLCLALPATAVSQPERARFGMVTSVNDIASEIGADVLREGGNAVDAAVATAFALAVVHPSAGNIGGGGFMVFRAADGEAITYDFREAAPASAHPEMWLTAGEYDFRKHHMSHLSVGVPGTVAGLHLAWEDHGTLPWKRLVEPAIDLARDGFPVSDALARSLARALERMRAHPASVAQFSKQGQPYGIGDVLRQPDLAATLQRIAQQGPDDFYRGRTAELLVAEMEANGGAITLEDLDAYRAKRREPVRGTYRGYGIIGMPPPSSGGTVMIEMLNILEGYDIGAMGFGSARALHRMVESMRRAYADRARYLGDPDYNDDLPIERLISKAYAAELRDTIRADAASESVADRFEWPGESEQTTHFSVVDRERNGVAVTYTLEWGYGSAITVPGAGFLLNNELGDFNAKPGLTDERGLIGTAANLAEPGKRPLSSMSPTIVEHEGDLFLVTGSPGGRTIINTVMQTILNVVDHGMNAQEAVEAGRIHHQWLPDVVRYERNGLSPDTLDILRWLGHDLEPRSSQGSAQIILVRPGDGLLEAGIDRRQADSGAGIW